MSLSPALGTPLVLQWNMNLVSLSTVAGLEKDISTLSRSGAPVSLQCSTSLNPARHTSAPPLYTAREKSDPSPAPT